MGLQPRALDSCNHYGPHTGCLASQLPSVPQHLETTMHSLDSFNTGPQGFTVVRGR